MYVIIVYVSYSRQDTIIPYKDMYNVFYATICLQIVRIIVLPLLVTMMP